MTYPLSVGQGSRPSSGPLDCREDMLEGGLEFGQAYAQCPSLPHLKHGPGGVWGLDAILAALPVGVSLQALSAAVKN